ncbi:MAG: serine hydrolase [Candidatus Gracilibacteria bacterium]
MHKYFEEKKTRYTKKQIIIIAVIVILCVSIFNVWIFASYSPSCNKNITTLVEAVKNRYPFLNPAQSFYEKKDMIVDIQSLREELTKLGKNRRLTIYFEFLNTGANIAVNKELTLWPGSLMKMPIAMAVMKKIEKGEWRLDDELVLLEEDVSPDFGELYKEPVGTRYTIEKLLEEMLINSDNTARTIFMRNLGGEERFNVVDHLGIEDVINENQEVNSKRYSVFWRALFSASYLSPEHSQKLLEILTETPFENYLALGLPKNVKFTHKIGVNEPKNIYADSGIVFVPNRPYILTVMMEERDKNQMEYLMKLISKKTYDYVSSYEE